MNDNIFYALIENNAAIAAYARLYALAATRRIRNWIHSPYPRAAYNFVNASSIKFRFISISERHLRLSWTP